MAFAREMARLVFAFAAYVAFNHHRVLASSQTAVCVACNIEASPLTYPYHKRWHTMHQGISSVLVSQWWVLVCGSGTVGLLPVSVGQ